MDCYATHLGLWGRVRNLQLPLPHFSSLFTYFLLFNFHRFFKYGAFINGITKIWSFSYPLPPFSSIKLSFSNLSTYRDNIVVYPSFELAFQFVNFVSYVHLVCCFFIIGVVYSTHFDCFNRFYRYFLTFNVNNFVFSFIMSIPYPEDLSSHGVKF